MKLKISCVSDAGRIRDNNEDMASVGMYLVRDNSLNVDKEVIGSESFCLLVSDGMGGHESGEYASQFTLETLRAFLLDKSLEHHDPVSDLALKIKDISASLNIKARERRQGKAMGCTLTGIVWMQGKTLLVNAGDSRTYRLRDGMLRQLTVDQTIHERDMVPLPAGKALYNCIGAGCDTEVYIQDISDRLMESDRILVCSDGLSDMLDDEVIERLLDEGSPEESSVALAEAAKRNGGADNITAIVADIFTNKTESTIWQSV